VALVEQPGRLLDKDTLLAKIWPDTFAEESNLADNVFKLRRALGDGGTGARFIEARSAGIVSSVAFVSSARPSSTPCRLP
jgi:transcriptional regulator HilA, main transcriptional regulator of SPI1